MNNMNNNKYEILNEKIRSRAQNAPDELRKELYPEKLGQRVMMQAKELRLITIARYEGMSIILKELGADVSKLEATMEDEAKKTLEGKY